MQRKKLNMVLCLVCFPFPPASQHQLHRHRLSPVFQLVSLFTPDVGISLFKRVEDTNQVEGGCHVPINDGCLTLSLITPVPSLSLRIHFVFASNGTSKPHQINITV